MSNAVKSIELPEDLQAFAEERVRAGEYESVTEVAAQALRLLRQHAERRERVRGELEQVFREMDEGTGIEPSDEEFAQAVHERALKRMHE